MHAFEVRDIKQERVYSFESNAIPRQGEILEHPKFGFHRVLRVVHRMGGQRIILVVEEFGGI